MSAAIAWRRRGRARNAQPTRQPGLTTTADSDEREQYAVGKPGLCVRQCSCSPDERCPLGTEVVSCRLGATFGYWQGQAVAQAGHSGDGAWPQRLAQRRYLNLHVCLLDHQAGPRPPQQFVLGDQFAACSDECPQQINRPGAQRHRAALVQQRAAGPVDLEVAESKCRGRVAMRVHEGTVATTGRARRPGRSLLEGFWMAKNGKALAVESFPACRRAEPQHPDHSSHRVAPPRHETATKRHLPAFAASADTVSAPTQQRAS